MPESNADQIAYWNAAGATAWVGFQHLLDRQLEPLGEAALRSLGPLAGKRVLDVGCGCGHSSIALAERVGPSGAVLGVDISEPMLAVARERAAMRGLARLHFRAADAQDGDFGGGTFDAVFSRFGVMFFADPVAAFGHLRAALSPGGRLVFVCWRALRENAWMRAPLEAALPFLPPLPPPEPGAPGPFAFADKARVEHILGSAGFSRVSVEPFDTAIGGNSLDGSLRLALGVGPLGKAVRENPGCAGQVTGAVRPILEDAMTPDGVRMPAAVWIAGAYND